MLSPPPAETFGSFRIIRKIGAGGMGAVYLAHDTRLGRTVALKIPRFNPADDDQASLRFHREARIAAQLPAHPHLCPVYEAGRSEDVDYLVMAYVEGEPLSRYLARPSPWHPAEAAALVCQLAGGLAVLHAHSIVHRDLKASNVLLRPDGRAVLLDYGLARSFTAGHPPLTKPGDVLGTPGIMAPEQLLPHRGDVGPPCDVWALGVLLYQLLTGQSPFGIGNFHELSLRILTAPVAPPSTHRPGLDPRFDALCASALAKEPSDRPADGYAFLQRAWPLATLAPAAETVRVAPRHRPARKSNRSSVFALAACFLAVVCLTLGVAIGRFHRSPNAEVANSTLISTARVGTEGLPARTERLPERVPLPPLPEFDLALPGQVRVVAGEGAEVKLGLRRENLTGPVFLSQQNPVPGVSLQDQAGDCGEAKVRLATDFALSPGKYTVEVRAQRVPGVEVVRQITLVVEPPPPKITNSIGMKLVLIPAGKTTIGPTHLEAIASEDALRKSELQMDRDKNDLRPGVIAGYLAAEHPRHQVEITSPYYAGVYEVTQGEFEKVMGTNPSYFHPDGPGAAQVKGHDTANWPVEAVSWDAAAEFCAKLSEMPAEKKAGRRYRLPTSAEWEHACRGGIDPPQYFHCGNKLDGNKANILGFSPFGLQAKTPFLGRTREVGSYEPNAFGLFDMHGNVWEWCSDWYGKDYYADSPAKDPQGPATGTMRVRRGGAWNTQGLACRSAFRMGWHRDGDFKGETGFRVVCVQGKAEGAPQ